MRLAIPALLLAAPFAIAAAPAMAQDQSVTVRIDLSDVDLARDDARMTLEERIEERAREACTINARSRYTYGRSLVDEDCVAQARRAALAQAERMIAARARTGRAIAAN